MTHKMSHAAHLSSELQTPLYKHLFHIITWTDNRHLKSNMFTSKLLIFVPEPKPVLPTDFQSPLMTTPYFSTAQTKEAGVILIPYFSLTLRFHPSANLTLPSKYIHMHNISPLPPSPKPIIFPLTCCRSHTAGFLSLAFVYLSSTLSTKGRWYLKVGSQIMLVICSKPTTGFPVHSDQNPNPGLVGTPLPALPIHCSVLTHLILG